MPQETETDMNTGMPPMGTTNNIKYGGPSGHIGYAPSPPNLNLAQQ